MRRLLRERDRGGAVEMAIITPALLLLLVFAIYVLRAGRATSSVQSAAYDAARAASISRGADTARRQASQSAADALGQAGVTCAGGPAVSADTAGFSTAPGTPASVRVSIRCQIPVSDLAMPGLGGTRTVTAEATSPIDTYRARR